MTLKVSMRQRHASYGVLFTALALVIAIVYASETYDDWDAIIGFLGSAFGVSYLGRVPAIDVVEWVLASFLAGLSGAIFVVSMLALLVPEAGAVTTWMDARLLQVALSIGAALGLGALLVRRILA